jgi:hypothetical protein
VTQLVRLLDALDQLEADRGKHTARARYVGVELGEHLTRSGEVS